MNDFSQYIKLIGKGKRAGKYLTVEQAYQAFQLLLANKVAPEQAGAFLMLLRVREESVEELAGFVKACREFSLPELSQVNADIDLGCYAGKRRHLPWFLLAVICLAQTGKRIFLHGTREPESNRLYLPQVFSALNIPISSSANEAKEYIDKYGFAYMDLSVANPELERLIQMRSLFGLRSPANTLARMLNPAQAKMSFHGVFHRHFDQRHVDVAKLLDDQNVACIRGEGGEVEVNPERAFDLYIQQEQQQVISFPSLLENWQIKPSELKPEELEQLWTGELDFQYGHQAVIGTLACLLILSQQADSSEQALEQAKTMWQQRNRQPFQVLFN